MIPRESPQGSAPARRCTEDSDNLKRPQPSSDNLTQLPDRLVKAKMKIPKELQFYPRFGSMVGHEEELIQSSHFRYT